MIETMLTKIKFLKNGPEKLKVQVIGMSATFPNLEEISQWIDGEVFISNFRPIKIKEYAKIGEKIITQDGTVERNLIVPKN